MKNNRANWAVFLFVLFIVISIFAIRNYYEAPPAGAPTPNIPIVLSFKDCEKANYPVLEIYPRQCKTPDGRTFAEEISEKITYKNATANTIVIDLPYPGAVIGKEFTVTGKARGTWFFEASFPIELIDSSGKSIVKVPAQAQGDQMTENFIPFRATIKVPETFIGKATLTLRKDNPSGMPERDASISLPITIEY